MDLRKGKLRVKRPFLSLGLCFSLHASPCLAPSLLQQISFFVAHPPPRLPILQDMPLKNKIEREIERERASEPEEERNKVGRRVHSSSTKN